jgi:hypothetical protein
MTSISDGLNSSKARPGQPQDMESDTAMMHYPYIIRVEGTRRRGTSTTTLWLDPGKPQRRNSRAIADT